MNRVSRTDVRIMTPEQKRAQLVQLCQRVQGGEVDRDAVAREFRALGTSGTAMVLGQDEADVIRRGFTLTTDTFLKSALAASN